MTERRMRRAAAGILLATAACTGLLLATGSLVTHGDQGVLSDVQTAASLKQKLAVESQEAQVQAAARNAPQPAKNPKTPRPAATPEPWPTGIFETPQAPFSTSLYQITNQWQGRIGDEFVQVYAGARTADPSQGVLVVLTTSALDLSDHTTTSGGFYPLVASGSLRIVAGDASGLSISSARGLAFTFDLKTRALTPR